MAARTAHITFPLDRLYLEYTNRCNMSCAFCPYPLQRRPKGRLRFELCRNIVDQVVSDGITDLIEVTGYGEPLLNPEWENISRHIIASGLRLNLTTNGALLTDPVSERVAACGFNDIIISLQTPDRDSFRLRKAPLEYETYIARVKRFIEVHQTIRSKSRIRLRLLNTIGAGRMAFPEKVSVLDSRDDVVASMRDWGRIVRGLAGVACDESAVRNGLRRFPTFRPAEVHVTDRVTLESKLCNDFWAFGTGEPVRFPTRIARCRAMTMQNVLVYHDGRVSLCCSDFDNYLNIGSLTETTLKHVLCSEKAMTLVDGFRHFRVRHPYCQHCLGSNVPYLSAAKALAASFYQLNLEEFRVFDLRHALARQ